jgi:uncharacterized membrane protein YgcG
MAWVKVLLGISALLFVAGITVGPGFLVALAIAGAVVGGFALLVQRARQQSGRDEALFVSMFPDLQPYFHPRNLLQYVQARVARKIDPHGMTWRNPPGLGVPAVDIRYDGEREITRLLDAAGARLAEFIFEPNPEGGVIRVGQGKFTVNDQVKNAPRVRYWHPDREFKWTPQAWKFVTRMSDQPLGGYDPSYSSSDTFSSSSSGSAPASGMSGGGGTFDGGGATGSWEGGSGGSGSSSSGGSSSSDSSSTASATSY